MASNDERRTLNGNKVKPNKLYRTCLLYIVEPYKVRAI